MAEKTKVVVIGGGPAGYGAAFMSADLGMETVLVDKAVNPGGVCLYRGCIPSKALLHVAKLLNEVAHAETLGIKFGKPEIDLDKLREFKNNVVKKLTGGLGQLSKQRKITYIQGAATFVNSNKIKVEKAEGGTVEIEYEKAILATGSVPAMIPNLPDSDRVLNSTTALDLPAIPDRMLVVGGGYIGLELGSVYAALGTKVTVVEMLKGLLPGADRDMVKILEKSISDKFENIYLETKVAKMEDTGKGLKVKFEGKTEKEETFDYVLVSVGRKPVTKGFGLENTKVQVNEKGFVKVKADRQTDDPSIYAIGDIAGDPMLAHKGTAEGKVAAEAIAGHRVAFEPAAIPAVVFTDPELAWAGLTETEAKERGVKYEVVKFPWAASGRAATLDRQDGVTKLLVDPETERVLGMGMVGVGAGDMIAEGVLAVEMAAQVKDVALSIHPHPTLSETVMESAESFFGQATHIYRPKRK